VRRPGLALKLSVLLVLGVVGAMLAENAVAPSVDEGEARARVLIFVCAALAMALVAAFVLDLLVIRPLGALSRHARRLDADLAAPFPVTGVDEPRELGEALERLRQRVVAERDELRRLNAELEARAEERGRSLVAAQAELVAKERLAAVGRLAAGVAHEVNNPAGVILGRASLAIDEHPELPGELAEDLRVMQRQAARIKEITQALLRLGRPATGERLPIDLADVARSALALVRREAEAAGVKLDADLEPAPARGDAAALEQVAYNLLRNAIQAAPGGRVRLSTERTTLAVEDSGPGIPAEVLPRIFEPFFTTKPVGSGTGLGLAVAHGIVAEHGGALTATNRPDGGARFVMRLPSPG
jgi:signal transduction histidine kinase